MTSQKQYTGPYSGIPKDLLAGTVVFLVALPLCLGIALASGAPMFAGIISGIIGGIVVGSLSGSHTSVSGPAAGLTAIIATQILELGSFQAFLLATVFAGVFQVIMGFFRAGFIAAFFPSTVIKGLLAAIGIILILKQIPHLLGHDPDLVGEMAFIQPDGQSTFSELIQTFFSIQPGAAMIGLLSLGFLFFWDKVKRLKENPIPSALLVVLLGIFLNYLMKIFFPEWEVTHSHLVQLPIAANSAEAFAFIQLPDFSQLINPSIYLTGFVVAMVASLETLLNLEAVDKLDPLRRHSPPNRELLAQGTGNIISGFIGGLPMTSVVIRSTVNINSGGKSRTSAIFHGVLLIICIFAIPQWINLIPLASLAAILIMTGFKLTSPKLFQKMWRSGFRQFAPFIVTILAIVLIDLMIGTLVGLAISMGFILYTNYQRPLKKYLEHHVMGDVLRIELSSQVSFFSRAALEKAFNEIPNGGDILIDARKTDFIDPDVLDFIQDYMNQTAPIRNIKVSYIGLKNRYEQIQDRIQYVDYASSDVQPLLTPSVVLEMLRKGNDRFRTGEKLTRNLMRQVKATSTGQTPMAVILSCIDSRTPAELIFDLGIGDIFSIRIAGNVAKEKVLGSMEYACAIAKAKLILVLGHTSCGAIQSAVSLFEKQQTAFEATGCEHLDSLIREIQKSLPNKTEMTPNANYLDEVSKANVTRVTSLIRQESKVLDDLCTKGEIAIIGGLYNIQNGQVQFLNNLELQNIRFNQKLLVQQKQEIGKTVDD